MLANANRDSPLIGTEERLVRELGLIETTDVEEESKEPTRDSGRLGGLGR